MQQTITINYHEFNSINELNPEDKKLLEQAIAATALAYAPYSNFKVGAAALLSNNTVIVGSNQENASYGATICAERVLLGNLSAIQPNNNANHTANPIIKTMAISYVDSKGNSNKPLACCGICRQVLLEYEERIATPVKLILGGMAGKVWIFDCVANLLPVAFSKDAL